MKNSSKTKFYILIAFVFVIIFAQIFFHFSGDYSRLHHFLNSMAHSKYLPLIYLGLFVLSSFFPIPFLTFAGAGIFPFWKVLFYSLLGNFILFTIMFYIARWLGRDYFEKYKIKHPKLRKIDFNFEKNSFSNIILLRFFFIIPSEFVNILGGISEMKFRNYFTASVIGILPVLISSILFVEGIQHHNKALFFLALTILFLLIIIPLLFIPKLRKYFK